MKSASATGRRAKSKKAKPAPKRVDRGVPFDEMRRLMRVYGSLKCLRNRQASSGDDAKIESVKRKFYRWFPDLDERFVKNEEGMYVPRLGHEAELKYRQDSRMKEGKTLTTKRAKCRRENHQRGKGKEVATCSSRTKGASTRANTTKRAHPPKSVSPDFSKSPPYLVHQPTTPSTIPRVIASPGVHAAAPASISFSGGPPLLPTQSARVEPAIDISAEQTVSSLILGKREALPFDRSVSVVSDSCSNPKVDTMHSAARSTPYHASVSADEDTDGSFGGGDPKDVSIKLHFDHDLVSSADIVAGTEPVDRSFVAEEGIFDDVEKDFFGARPRGSISIALPSSSLSLSSHDHDTTSSFENDSISIEDVIEKSIEECCEEMLGEDGSVSEWLF